MRTLVLLCAALILHLPAWQSASAYVLDLNDGLEHEISTDLGDARVRIDYETPDVQTRVTMIAGGAAEGIEAHEDARLFLNGGNVID